MITNKLNDSNKRTCPVCGGKGTIYNEYEIDISGIEDFEQIYETCPNCCGTGEITINNN